jgi:hypothetical protein
MTQRTENLLGVLALLVTDEMNAQNTVPALAGPTARAMLNAVGQYPNSSIEAGLIEKKPGADRRAVSLALTTAGRREAKRMQAARERMLQRVVGRLSDDERVLFEDLLIKILWHETRDPAHAMQLCRLCDDGPCLKAGCPVECREMGLPMPPRSAS